MLIAAGLLTSWSSRADQITGTNISALEGHAVVLTIVMYAILATLAWGWAELALLPQPAVPRTILTLIALASCGVAGFAHPQYLAYVAAFAVPLVFVGEMVRTDGRDHLLTHVSGVYAGGLVIIAGATWILLARTPGGSQLGMVGVITIIAGTLTRYFVPGRWREFFIFLFSGAAAVLATLVIGEVSWWGPAVFASVFLLVTWVMGRVARANSAVWQGSSAVAFVLLPHCAIGIAGYALGLLVI